MKNKKNGLIATCLLGVLLCTGLPLVSEAKLDACGVFNRWGLIGVRSWQSERVRQIADFFSVSGSGTVAVNGREVSVGGQYANTTQFITGFFVDCGFDFFNSCYLSNLGSIVYCIPGSSSME